MEKAISTSDLLIGFSCRHIFKEESAAEAALSRV